MSSAGNDIVSLSAINATRTKQYRFYSKIISAPEKAIYDGPGFETMPFENFVWLLWSIKEAAYKFVQRNKPELVFIPVKFEVEQIKIPAEFKIVDFGGEEASGTGFDDRLTLNGSISVGVDRLYSRSLMFKDAIMTVVSREDCFGDICWGLKIIGNSCYDYQSAAVRDFLINRLVPRQGFNDLTVAKNKWGVPVLQKGANGEGMPVSLSHHDYMIAYSFQSGGFRE